MDTKDDNKDVQMLKDEIWNRRQTTAKVAIIRRNQVVEEIILLEKIQRNGTKEQEVISGLKKKDGQSWKENGIVYIKGRIYISNNKRI